VHQNVLSKRCKPFVDHKKEHWQKKKSQANHSIWCTRASNVLMNEEMERFIRINLLILPDDWSCKVVCVAITHMSVIWQDQLHPNKIYLSINHIRQSKYHDKPQQWIINVAYYFHLLYYYHRYKDNQCYTFWCHKHGTDQHIMQISI